MRTYAPAMGPGPAPARPVPEPPAAPTGEPVRGPAAHVLVVDDDATVREVVALYLQRAGYTVEQAVDGPDALQRAGRRRPDLVVLDLMLPGTSGLEVHTRLQQGGPLPVVMLTALGQEEHRLAGLEVGADDYVTKPFSPRELVLRVAAVLRRTAQAPAPGAVALLVDGDLVVDRDAHQAHRDGRVLTLTARERDLLTYFLQHPRTALTREHLLEHVWGWTFGDPATVTVHVRRLREKVEPDPARPTRIVTVFGVGYRYEPAAG